MHVLLDHIIKKYFIIDFRSGKAPILVATDVAARGLGKLITPSLFLLQYKITVWYNINYLFVIQGDL